MTPSREEIKKNVVEQLFWDSRVDASAITVELTDSTVLLRGTVPTFLVRRFAEEDAKAVAGVVSVVNELTVRFPEGKQLPGDGAIKETVLRMLSFNPEIDHTDVSVMVDGGAVTLDGTVPAYWQKHRAEELAVNVDGVTHINNRLAVVPGRHYVDELIARDIEAALDRNADLNVNAINVQVENGMVLLSGSIPSWATFRTAEDIARLTDGVLEVVNHLVVDGSARHDGKAA